VYHNIACPGIMTCGALMQLEIPVLYSIRLPKSKWFIISIDCLISISCVFASQCAKFSWDLSFEAVDRWFG